MKNQSERNALVEIYDSDLSAQVAVHELRRGGFAMARLSIISKDFESEKDVVGFYNNGDRMKSWSKVGAVWGGLWGHLIGSGFFLVPGLGPIVVTGHLATVLVGIIEGAAVTGGLSAVGAGLLSVGIPKESVVKYETDIRAGKILLLAHGTSEEISNAREILETRKTRRKAIFVA
jgi:hypothetical protein